MCTSRQYSLSCTNKKQNSSIGNLVTDWLTHSLTHSLTDSTFTFDIQRVTLGSLNFLLLQVYSTISLCSMSKNEHHLGPPLVSSPLHQAVALSVSFLLLLFTHCHLHLLSSRALCSVCSWSTSPPSLQPDHPLLNLVLPTVGSRSYPEISKCWNSFFITQKDTT